MTVRSAWNNVDIDNKNRISFIEDISHLTGGMTITNDAENVWQYFQNALGTNWRVVYKDTDNEWWEIVPVHAHRKNGGYVRFDKWHGLAWDILKR